MKNTIGLATGLFLILMVGTANAAYIVDTGTSSSSGAKFLTNTSG